jgi:hypothetical protein
MKNYRLKPVLNRNSMKSIKDIQQGKGRNESDDQH